MSDLGKGQSTSLIIRYFRYFSILMLFINEKYFWFKNTSVIIIFSGCSGRRDKEIPICFYRCLQ